MINDARCAITDLIEKVIYLQPSWAPHPGAFIRDKILGPLKLEVECACQAMGLDPTSFARILDGRGRVTRDIAYRLEALTGQNANLLIDMQARYDLARELPLRRRYKQRIELVKSPAM